MIIKNKDGHRLTAHGTSFKSLEQFLKDNPQIEEVVACYNNDKAGILRSEKMCEEYSKKGYKTFLQLPRANDYNDQLVDYVESFEMKREVNLGIEME